MARGETRPNWSGKARARLPIGSRAPEAVLLAEAGLTQVQIAQQLGISDRRVRDLIAYARRNGWASPTRETRTARDKLEQTLDALHAQRDKVDLAITATESALRQLP